MAGIALVVAAVDVVSVFASFGVTNYILTEKPEAVPYFVVAFPTFGYSRRRGRLLRPGDGRRDLLRALSGERGRLRAATPATTAVAMAVSLVATVALAMWWRALPALPLLGLAFLAVNADRMFRRGASGRDVDEGEEPRV